MSESTTTDVAEHVACEAAHAWLVDLIDRLEALERSTGVEGYCVESGLRGAFNALPMDQQGAFLDAVGAYLMTCFAFGTPTRKAYMTPELLTVYASTPAQQNAFAFLQPEGDSDE